ncbi:TPA: prephenate dehydrogenase/arogenate dehydrogenase family protein, partial [Candidatus Bipolaricaulota bacterium]|nr:prephenate dehydrogenase/arogenate dehydrogenase family protein [Candidatus Bipolaricaulota bacterium]
MGSESGFPTKVAIVGVGLMGGSLALAIRRFCPGVEVVGIDYPPVLERARWRRALDRGHPPEGLAEGVAGADYVFLATPIRTIIRLIAEVAPLLKEGAILSDLGSTKVEICRTAERSVPDGIYFIGGHPLTGSEGRGIDHADPFLFQNAFYVLTPLNEPDEKTEELARFLERLGALILYLDPQAHDRIVAYTSHLPQLLAVGLTNLIGREDYLSLATGGFRDLTRVASSPYEIWEEILETNIAPIQEALDVLIKELIMLREQLGKGGLEEDFTQAARRRAGIPKNSKGFLRAFPRIAVLVPDRPGALAEITT